MADQANLHKNQVAEHFGNSSKNWDAVYGDRRDVNAVRIRERQRRILQYVDQLNLPAGSRVLDLGCGAGRASVELLQRGFDLEGVDISEDMVNLARQNAEQAGFTGSFNFQVGDAENLPFEDSSFDLIVSIGMLGVGPVTWGRSVMAELHRIVKPGGHVALTYPNMLSIGHAFSKIDVPISFRRFVRKMLGRSVANEKPAWVMDRTKYTPGQFNRMVGRIGFQTIGSVSLGYAPIEILGRSILSKQGALWLDNMLHRLAQRPGTGFLSRMGRTYLALVQKSPVAQLDGPTPQEADLATSSFR
ncbi:MAG: class I SAM-dependent methyltransferase [Dehalococcoidia bacterium]